MIPNLKLFSVIKLEFKEWPKKKKKSTREKEKKWRWPLLNILALMILSAS